MRRPEHVYLLEPDLFPDVTSRSQKTSRDGLFFTCLKRALRPDGQALS